MQDMNNDNNNDNMKDRVLAEIKHDHVYMQSRTRMRLRHLAAVVGLLFFVFLAVYFGSFIIFSRRVAGLGFRPHSYGEFFPFVIGLPWILILCTVGAIVLLEWLIRQYKIAYRKPIFFSLIFVILLALAGSLIFARIRFHENFADFAERRNMPFLRPLYHHDWQEGRRHGMFPQNFAR